MLYSVIINVHSSVRTFSLKLISNLRPFIALYLTLSCSTLFVVEAMVPSSTWLNWYCYLLFAFFRSSFLTLFPYNSCLVRWTYPSSSISALNNTISSVDPKRLRYVLFFQLEFYYLELVYRTKNLTKPGLFHQLIWIKFVMILVSGLYRWDSKLMER